MYRILNIVRDEKFIDDVITCHDMASGNCIHHYVIIGKPVVLKYIHFTSRIKFISEGSFLSYLLDNKYDAVYLHSLIVMQMALIAKIPQRVKVFWFSWGFDIYRDRGESIIYIKLHHEKTEALMKKLENSFLKKVKSIIKWVPNHVRDKKFNNEYVNAIKRVDYYSGVLPIEYDLCKKSSYFNAKRVVYKYLSPSSFSDISGVKSFSGNNILVGNSAAHENNHLDLIEYFKELDVSNRNIYVPLSYAGFPEYVQAVTCECGKIFGNSCRPLVDFISYDDYNKILQSCSVGVFFHERQQALGNIMLLLLMGCKVFLSETSIAYAHFKSLGVKVFSVQSELNQKEIDEELDNATKENNRKILNVGRSKSDYIKMMEDLYSVL